MEFKIEVDVPMPALRKSMQRRESKYPLDALRVGQSFLVPCERRDRKKTKDILTSASGQATMRAKHKLFVSRTVEGGIRVWRTA